MFSTIYQRTYLTISLLDNTQKDDISVILMNPSAADSTQSDNTVNGTINHLYQDQFKFITILNLFPIYDSNSSNLYNSVQSIRNSTSSFNLQNIIDNNLNTISNYIGRSSKIILAWGNCPTADSKFPTSTTFNATLFYNTIHNVLNMLKYKTNLYYFKFNGCSKLTQYGNPYPPSKKGLIQDLYELTQDPYLLTLS